MISSFNFTADNFFLERVKSAEQLATRVGVDPNLQPSIQTHTPYDYLTLMPVIITALTPLILGLRVKNSSRQNDKTKK